MKTLLCILLTILTLVINPIYIYAAGPHVLGRSLILMEKTTGTVLFDVNGTQRIFPASTTKILTALVASDYIGPNELILIGPEIHSAPPGSSRAFLVENTYISGINIFRGIIVTSGNDTANVIAREVARRVTGNEYISFEESQLVFAELMNKKAVSVGATNSNFVNPHGFHDDSHYSTPMDMVLIAQAALEVPLLVQIFAEPSYTGPGVIGDIPDNMPVANYNWNTGNLLLREDSEHFFPYAKGMRTGFHNQAQNALVSTAEKDGFELIAGAFQATADGRFIDSISMFNYGFDTYGFKQIQFDGTIVDNITFHNPMLGEITNMDVMAVGDFTDIFPKRDFDRVFSSILYKTERLYFPTAEEIEALLESGDWDPSIPRILLPVEEGEVIGEISYRINGIDVFTAPLVATVSALPRTMESDFYYYKAVFFEYITSTDSAPIWIGLAVIFLLILRSIFKHIRRSRRRKMFGRKGDRRLHYRYRRY